MNRQAGISVRPSAVAGRFFAADPERLRQDVVDCLEEGAAGTRPEGWAAPKAVISAHAGYPYSGWLTAASWLATNGQPIETIVVLSPSHQYAFHGLALPSQDIYRMPGFDVAIDDAARSALVAAGLAHVEDAAHDREHGVETQLPFLHRLHPRAQVVPLVIGWAETGKVAQAVDLLASLRKTPPLFILSSDLSHFLSLDAANAHDAETAKLIETGQYDKLTGAHACGAKGIAGFMASDFGEGMRVHRIAMSNSAAVTGDQTRTVGYGAWAMFSPTDEIVLSNHRSEVLRVARKALESYSKKGKMPHVDLASFPQVLRGYGASFVTLQKNGRLRGCIGSLAARAPIIRDVVENSVKSGFKDPRFTPVEAGEVADISIKVALLSPSAPMTFESQKDLLNQVVPGRDGLILRDQGKRAVFLPMVWESLSEPEQFLQALKEKAGLARDHWSESVEVDRFCAESFAEGNF